MHILDWDDDDDDDDDVLFALDQHAQLDFYSASSLKQQSVDSHVAQLGHIIMIDEPTSLSSYCCVLCGEAANTNFIIFGSTRFGLEPMIDCTPGEHANRYTTDAVNIKREIQ